MPANLTPEYRATEQEYRDAKEPAEKLKLAEKLLQIIPKHKGTDRMQADLKRRISQLKESLQKKSSKKGFAVTVNKEGAAQFTIVGSPNSGKSALVEATTNARVEVGDYPFSTRSPVPAMFNFEDIQFQLVDLPAVSREYMEPWVTDIIRTSDGVLWLIDPGSPELENEIAEVQEILEEKKIELVQPDYPVLDRAERIRRLPTLVLATKLDEEASKQGLAALEDRFRPRQIPVIATSAMGDSEFPALAAALFDLSRVVRVYSKQPASEPDLTKPFIMRRGDTLVDFAAEVHKDFVEKLRFARVWGEGKFDGQRIQRDQELVDKDVVELHV